MIRGLIEKELRQHGLALLFVLLLVWAGVVVILQNRFLHTAFGTPFAALRFLLLTFVPLACLVLGQALIDSEYQHKTQLFLEGLPLPRWRMIAIKYGLGLSLMLAAVAVVLAFAWRRSLVADAVTPRFLLLLALRSVCYVWFMWSLCFAHGFMGRYRFLFGVIAFVIIKSSIIIQYLNFGVIGPFELIGDRFAYERYLVPVTQLAVTAAYALFWTVTGLMLGLARDATISTALAQRMSSREKMLLTFGVVAGVLVLGGYAERSKTPSPVLLPGAVETTRGGVQVAASAAVDQPTEEENAALDRVARRVADELSVVAVFLRCEKMPPVFIIHRRDLKPGTLEDGGIKKEQGVMVRANLTAKEFKMDTLLRWIVYEALARKSLGRLNLERNAWVLDGFTNWWLTHRVSLGEDSDELRAAIKAMPQDFSAHDLDRWLTLRQNAGKEEGRELAATGLRVLASRHGDEACRDFLVSVLGAEVKKDPRAWLCDVFNPVANRFRKTTGTSLEAFVAEWRDVLRKSSARLPEETKP